MKHTRDSIVAIICECRKNGTDIVLRGADLSGLDLRGLDLRDADLRGADLDFAGYGLPEIEPQAQEEK